MPLIHLEFESDATMMELLRTIGGNILHFEQLKEEIMEALDALKQEVQDLKAAELELKGAVGEVATAIQTKLAAKDAIIQQLMGQVAAGATPEELAVVTEQLDLATKDVAGDVASLRAIVAPPPPVEG